MYISVCEDGYYGPGCANQCSIHCAEACDKFSETGACSGNCLDGYITDNCTEGMLYNQDISNMSY